MLLAGNTFLRHSQKPERSTVGRKTDTCHALNETRHVNSNIEVNEGNLVTNP